MKLFLQCIKIWKSCTETMHWLWVRTTPTCPIWWKSSPRRSWRTSLPTVANSPLSPIACVTLSSRFRWDQDHDFDLKNGKYWIWQVISRQMLKHRRPVWEIWCRKSVKLCKTWWAGFDDDDDSCVSGFFPDHRFWLPSVLFPPPFCY